MHVSQRKGFVLVGIDRFRFFIAYMGEFIDEVSAPVIGCGAEIRDFIVTCSTCHREHLPANLLDRDPQTYWKSDARMPHSINIFLPHIYSIKAVSLYLNVFSDKDYSPNVLLLRYGDHPSEMMQYGQGVDCPVNKKGFVTIYTEGITCSSLQVVIPSNFENGRNSIVRELRIFGEVHKEPEKTHNFLHTML
ncbi:hypothetical protein PCE1_002916 [Barthelona sp. PCE]